MRSSWPLAFAGALCVVYLGLAAIAYFHFPGPYNPIDNWLSDLGNRVLNPTGAIYYRAASIAGGVLMGAFFVSLGAWRSGKTVVQAALVAMQLLGMLAGAAFVMTGIYPDDLWRLHDSWAETLFGSFAMSLVVSLIAFPVRRRRYRALMPLAILCWCSVVAGSIYHHPILEWTSLATFLAYLAHFGIILAGTVPRAP